ncbi:hypothetical protein GCK32_021101, partial [Trichostrongylus colubriformis]
DLSVEILVVCSSRTGWKQNRFKTKHRDFHVGG